MAAIETPAQTPADSSYALGFSSLEEEIALDDLPVQGQLPAWLSGRLIRVTPALLEIGGKTLEHWFDGLAMLNAFSFADGRVSYANRFLETEAYRKAREGEVGFVSFAADPCRSLFKRVTALFEETVNDNANVNVIRLGEQYRALTEVPLPVEFDPETLETVGLALGAGIENAKADRLDSGQRAGLHAQLRDERSLCGARRVPVRCQPAAIGR